MFERQQSITRYNVSKGCGQWVWSIGDATAVADVSRGVKCIKVHPQGHQVAIGDRTGNLKYVQLYLLHCINIF